MYFRTVVAVTACIATVLIAPESIAQQFTLKAKNDGIVVDKNWRPRLNTIAINGMHLWRKESIRPGIRYLRIHIDASDLPEGIDGQIEIAGESGSQTITFSDLRKRRQRWSHVIFGEYYRIDVMSPQPVAELGIHIDRIAVQQPGLAAYSTHGETDDKQTLNHEDISPVVFELERPVAQLNMVREEGLVNCTGFMISESELMTNYHCVDSQQVCDSLVATFGYRRYLPNRLDFGKTYQCRSFDPSKSSASLDFAIVTLDGSPGAEFGFLPLAGHSMDQPGKLLLIQHPAGKEKKVAQINCQVISVVADGLEPNADFTHTCDTETGSSGSPVFDTTGRLVGLHHFGFMDDGAASWTENRAVRISKISAMIAGQAGSN